MLVSKKSFWNKLYQVIQDILALIMCESFTHRLDLECLCPQHQKILNYLLDKLTYFFYILIVFRIP